MKLPNTIEELQRMLLEVLVKLSAQEEEINRLRKENAALKAENAELRRRLAQNSRNSHKPPSSDGYKKKKIVSVL
ncbi:MAG: DUF6444 domain-containing protein, partial [Raineya sp.]